LARLHAGLWIGHEELRVWVGGRWRESGGRASGALSATPSGVAVDPRDFVLEAPPELRLQAP